MISHPPLLAARAATLASLAALAACGVFKSNDEAQATVNQRVVGMQAGDFFQQFGKPRTRTELPDGAFIYEWISATGPTTNSGYLGLDDRTCSLRLVSDARGKISSVDVVRDNVGRVSTSRCVEMFKAK